MAHRLFTSFDLDQLAQLYGTCFKNVPDEFVLKHEMGMGHSQFASEALHIGLPVFLVSHLIRLCEEVEVVLYVKYGWQVRGKGVLLF